MLKLFSTRVFSKRDVRFARFLRFIFRQRKHPHNELQKRFDLLKKNAAFEKRNVDKKTKNSKKIECFKNRRIEIKKKIENVNNRSFRKRKKKNIENRSIDANIQQKKNKRFKR